MPDSRQPPPESHPRAPDDERARPDADDHRPIADHGRARPGADDHPPVEIRRLGYSDLPQVVAIERRAFPTPWSLAMFVLELSKPSGVCLAAVEDNHLVGYLVCSRYDNAWHLMNVAVDPDRRRRGIASTLLDRLFAATDDGRGRFTLEVRPSNQPAIALYERVGFRAAGTRRRYYQDNGEDALVMWRTPATLAGSLSDVPNADGAPSARDLA
jgi:ribosomal-protein-alanine N-acetyltransferase